MSVLVTRGGKEMLKKGPFNFNQFQQRDPAQKVYDSEFVQSE